MIDQSAEKIAIFLNKRNEGTVSKDVMKFALIIIFNIIAVIAITLLLGIFTNTLKESSLALFGFGILRFFSGGFHVKSSVNCVIISVLLFSFIIYFPIPNTYEIYLQIFSSLLVIIFAPAYLESHIRIKKRYIPFLKIISICIVCSNFYLGSSILTKCFLLQSLSLIEFRKKGGDVHETTSV
jgi:accessory gene regulator B